MRVEIQHRSRIPYGGGYTWKDPLSGISVFGTNWDMLMTNARAERRANNLPMGLEFESEVERDLCKNYPQECLATDPSLPPRNQRLTFGDVVRGTEVMIAHKLAGSPLVDQAEANRRAAICSNCQFNTEFRMPCGGRCASLESLVQKISGSKTTPYDNNVRSCGICKCYTSVAVWLPLNIQCISVTQEMKTQFSNVPNCWKQCP